MTIKVAIHHHTAYRFDRLATIMPHVVRLRPAPHCRTPVQSYSLKIQPDGYFINWQQDPFSNYLARLVFPEKARELVVDVELIVDMTVINPFDFFLEEAFETFPFEYAPQIKRDLAPYLQAETAGPLLQEWLTQVDLTPAPSMSFLVTLNQRLQKDISYLIRLEAGVQSCEETLAKGSGSCRDSAWLLVQILRHLGLAARFVSGYLVQLAPDVKALDGPSGPEQDFTDLHAWTEVFLPGAGWVGLDPTSGMLTAEGHIPLACTPDPVSAAAITGATSPCEVNFDYHNRVTRIHEDPRVTKPYSEAQWQQIQHLGLGVDEALEAQDLRLTMGGEPTFVSIDDMDGAQWNTAALGKEKSELAETLLLHLKQHFAPRGLLHRGQGKWYPGEPLPRWAKGIYWRSDGEPLWQDAALLASPTDTRQCSDDMAATFMQALCQRLGIEHHQVLPAYEDQHYYQDKAETLPVNATVEDNKLKDPLERQRLKKVFQQGLQRISGYVLPLAWESREDPSGKDGHWLTSSWPLRREKLFLLPGDSPLGLRLPLDSLPWEQPEKQHQDLPRDPFSDLPPLPGAEHDYQAEVRVSPDKVIHTALCVEVRNGKLHLFMPPLAKLEAYMALLSHLEAVAKSLQQAVIIEGYEPPRDARLKKLMITPDPGVIEVNIHPAASWPELLDIIEPLYDMARQCRLGTEKFMLDGRHVGTGGGNHVTLGAATAANSPFLRKPHLLASLIRYWQNHPSLSYLFSGQFIGPTSQAPRVDEARDDNLYELEIALQQLPSEEEPPPWLIDRILRNFLVDLTGNTHRAEFCIDKLYSPDSSSGRLGLVEFRNFEMPPHWRMSAVQMLLLRSLVAWFAKSPYQRPFIRWGSQLHDRFMLPHFIWEDIKWVVTDLNDAGFAFDLDWLLPFQNFRFPHLGRLHTAGLQLDLNAAIEPWHVLGEESSGQGTARYVDSSVERLQLKVQGMTGNRLAITCNGRRIPLQATGRQGEFVGGVRYKAWAPYSALHPSIPVHSPLVFDVVDTVNQRSLGGCTYHVSHPGGRNYDTFPVNAYEAEARRVARFASFGHTQGQIQWREEAPHPERPYTLDLRYLDMGNR